MIHEFVLIRTKNETILENLDLYLNIASNNFNNSIKDSFEVLDRISIDDNFFSYFEDYLSWIPMVNYHGETMTLIDNRHGCGYINNCLIIKDFLLGLKMIFNLAPLQVNLKVQYVLNDEGNISFNKTTLSKSDIISKLDNLLNMILTKTDIDYILHIGI